MTNETAELNIRKQLEKRQQVRDVSLQKNLFLVLMFFEGELHPNRHLPCHVLKKKSLRSRELEISVTEINGALL